MSKKLRVVETIHGYKMEVGCYVDSHHGQYMIDEAVQVADMVRFQNMLRMGVETTTDDVNKYQTALTIARLAGDDELEHIVELWDAIEEYLNGLLPEDSGYSWGDNDGDWGLYPVDDDNYEGWSITYNDDTQSWDVAKLDGMMSFANVRQFSEAKAIIDRMNRDTEGK